MSAGDFTGRVFGAAIAVLIAFLLIGFYVLSSNKSEDSRQIDCLGDFTEFVWLDEDQEYPDWRDAPLSPWVFETQLTESKTITAKLARTNGGRVELWLLQEEYPYGVTILPSWIIYYPQSQEARTIPAETNRKGIWVNQLFLDGDGTLWGRNSWRYPLSADPPYGNVPVLSKYDESLQQFIVVEQAPQVYVDPLSWSVTESDLPQIGISGSSIFWIFLQEDGLYSFDSQTQRSEKVADLVDWTVYPLHVGIDGKVYFQKFTGALIVYEYEIEEDSLSPVELPNEGLYGSWSLFVDDNLNLWTSAHGWRDRYGEWHVLDSALETNADYQAILKRHFFGPPAIILESSNGWLWFQKYKEFDHGTAWLDPESGEGCWFASASTDVVEDPFGVVWMATGGKLFSFDLYP